MSVPAQRLPMVDMPPMSDARSRRFGTLQALGPAKATLPLAGVRVRARVADRIAEVTVEQRYSNPLTEAIKASKLKVQAQIQGDKVRVIGKKRDDLQEAIAFLRKAALGVPLQFNNFRD